MPAIPAMAAPRGKSRVARKSKTSKKRAKPRLLAPGGIDLHSHLVIKDGLKFLISGDLHEPARSTFWKSRLTTKISFENLDQTGLDVIVVSLYAHPWVAFPLEESLKKQVTAVEDWVAKNPRWVIAASPAEARSALGAGKKVIILSMEGAFDLYDTPAQRDYWIGQRRIRIVTPLHLTPDALGGPALMGSFGMLSAPGSWLASWVTQERDVSGVYINPYGLSGHGRDVISNLIKEGVWIDLAHSSDRSQKEIYPRMKVAGQPALYTHTMLRKYHRKERGVSDEQLEWVKESGGMVGLLIAQDMVRIEKDTAPGHRCIEGFGALVAHWTTTTTALGNDAVTIGSDFNAPLMGLEPRCLKEEQARYFADRGFHRAEQLPELFKVLEVTPEQQSAKVEWFLKAWERFTAQP